MAENKKSFLLYCDLIHTVEKLPNEKAGELFKHILMYVNDQNPKTNDLIIDLTFEPIKQQLKRDLKRYEETINNKSLNGRLGNLKRWNNDLYNKVVDNQLDIEEAESIAKHRKTSLSDFSESQTSQSVANVADNVNDNDNDNVNDKEIKEENNNTPLAFSFYNSLLKYGFDKQLVSEWLKVRKNKKLTNSETAYKGFIKEVEKSKLDKNEVLKECVINSWGGFKADWYKKEEKKVVIPTKYNFG